MTDIIVPEGWVEARLPQVANISTGKVDANHAVKNGKYAFYTCAIEPLKSDTYSFEGELLILPGNGANVGHVKFYNGRLEAYQRTYIIYNINIIAKFLFWSLKERWKQLTIEKQYGSATNYIKIGNFNNYVFFMPPLAEQEEIAQRVDRAIGHVDELESRLETLLTTLKTFRQSVLNAAVTGKLTESWTVTPLKELTIKIGSGSTPKGGQEVYKTTGIPLIRSMNIHFDKIKFEDLVYIDDKQADKLKNVAVKENDILLNITGASIGRVNIAPASLEGARVNQHVSILRCKPELLFPKFLKTILSSTLIQNWINNENYGATRQALTKSMIENLEISFPPLKEQEEIVKRVEAYFALADQIEKQVQSALDKVNLLTQSILAKAFRGELTKEWRKKNPELISGENSAEALLKRIKAEKDALEKPLKKTKRTKVKTA